jgi:type VI secretion system protein ImpL
MKSIGIALLWILGFAFLLLLCWVFVLIIDWPAWGAIPLFLGVIALYFLIKLLRRLWIVARSRARIAQSEVGSLVVDTQKSSIKNVIHKWREGLHLLRSSTLRKYGNPLYALPWYLVIGEAGSGKTSAITRSNLATLIRNVDPNTPIQSTKNIEWWFFNDSVLIDTSGRYIRQDEEASSDAEWEKLLDLLASARFREGISGLVLTVDAKKLLSDELHRVESYGRSCRERIDQLVRLFDSRFPVYILVTKCDQIEGFTTWMNALPEEDVAQGFGYLGNESDGNGSDLAFLELGWQALEDRLKSIRLALAMRGKGVDPSSLSFPAELARLKTGLEVFVHAALGYNTYLEQPLFRGFYLCSAEAPSNVNPDRLSKSGAFLQAFFERILPRDRFLNRPTMLVNRWRALTRNIALTFWAAFCVSAVLFLLVSFNQINGAFSAIKKAYPDEQVLNSSDVDDQTVVILAMKKVIDVLLDHEDKLGTRWLAFSPKVSKLEEDIKADFVKRVTDLINTHGNRITVYEDVLSGNDSLAKADAVVLLVRHINLLQARINGATYKDLLKLPQMPMEEAVRLKSVMAERTQSNYSHMFTAYIAWAPSNSDHLRLVLNERRELLKQFLLTDQYYTWLVDWADNQSGVKAVYLKDYWLPEASSAQSIRVRGAYTRAGEAHILKLLEEIGSAFSNSEQYRIKRAEFDRWYWSERRNAWQSFAWSFPQGESLLQTEAQWRDMLARVNTSSGPYFRFIDRLNEEFASVAKDDLPDWLAFSREIDKYRSKAKIGAGSLRKFWAYFDAFNEVGGQSIRDSFSGGAALLPSELKKVMASIDAYRKFRADFDIAAADAVKGDAKSLELSSDFFKSNASGDSKASSVLAAYDSFIDFRKSSAYNLASDQVVWNLLAGPVQMLVRYTNEQASCALQADWEKSVLLKTKLAITSKELSQQLYGPEGTVWAFLDGPAKPFVGQRADGFQPVKVKEFVFPFMSDFFPYLNKSMAGRVEQIVREQRAEASKGKFAKLTLTSRPISVNPGAKSKPYAAILTMQCTTGEVILNNFNTAATDTLTWSPESCGDVSLQIKIDNMSLTRRYPGTLGLAEFVKDFQDGERRFTPLDFPSVKSRLDSLGVKYISVRYDFSGQDNVLQLAEGVSELSNPIVPALMLPGLARKQVFVPQRIGQCWSQGGPDETPSSVSMMIQSKAQEAIAKLGQPVMHAEVEKPKPIAAAVPAKRAAKQKNKVAHTKQTKPAAPAESLYFIQVGVYSSNNNIRAVETQLTNLGMKMQLEAMDGNLSGAKRVLVGPYSSKEAASQALNRLTMLGMGGLVVKRARTVE